MWILPTTPDEAGYCGKELHMKIITVPYNVRKTTGLHVVAGKHRRDNVIHRFVIEAIKIKDDTMSILDGVCICGEVKYNNDELEFNTDLALITCPRCKD